MNWVSMKVEVRENGFDRALNEWVRAALARGVCTFPELVRSLPGVYPVDARRALESLRHELPADWQVSNCTFEKSTADGWPIEHPLDFDWRFASETVQILIDQCECFAPEHIAFLGTPSLAREVLERGSHARVDLFDQSSPIIAAVRHSLPSINVVHTDLVWDEPVDVGTADVSVADPPWYPEHIAAFLWAASRLTRIGGRVLLSLPPVGTRPGILAEREAIFAEAKSFGLSLVSLEQGILAYRTPPFERNALAAAGICGVPIDWRHGELAEFLVTDKRLIARPEPTAPREVWDHVAAGVVRIKCRRNQSSVFNDPGLMPVLPGDILTSVSRRDALRAIADVWTCGNRIYRCAGTHILRAILSALARGTPAEKEVTEVVGRELLARELEQVLFAIEQAGDLIRREKWEIEHGMEGRGSHLDESV